MLAARLRYSVATQTPSNNANDISDTSCPACQRQKSRTSISPREKHQSNYASHCFARFSKPESLETLATGLEGRNSGKPLSLLMDQLQHPCLDAGLDLPSLLDWKNPEEHQEHKVVDHVVLGKGPPGGAWHVSLIASAC